VPTYEYRCKDCGQELEVVQSFTDDALTTCEACGGNLRKVFGSVGIAFKGSGFYKNDSRGKAPATAGANGNGSDKADAGSSSTSGNGSDTAAAKEPSGANKDTKKDTPKDTKKDAKAPAASSS
jgi:putative FmdB family regulatory protein